MKPTAHNQTPHTERYHGLVARMLNEAREEITRADTKASILLALYTALQVVLLSALASGDWSPAQLGACYCAAFYAGWLFTLAGTFMAGLAVYPRTVNRGESCMTYFGHVAACKTIAEMEAALAAASSSAAGRDEEQLWTVSRIVKDKYGHIRQSMWLSLIGLLMCGVTVLAS